MVAYNSYFTMTISRRRISIIINERIENKVLLIDINEILNSMISLLFKNDDNKIAYSIKYKALYDIGDKDDNYKEESINFHSENIVIKKQNSKTHLLEISAETKEWSDKKYTKKDILSFITLMV